MRLMFQILNLMHTSLRKGPSLMQSEVMFSHSVKLLGKLLQLQEKIPSLRPNLSNLQLQISATVSEVLESNDDDVEVSGNSTEPLKSGHFFF